MNKHKLIKKIRSLDKLYGEKYYVALEDVLDLVKQLDEPQKVVVPQFVAEWIEYFKKCSGTLYGSTAPYSYYGQAITDDFEGDVTKVLGWIRNNSEAYARAWLGGYEVEKEKRYTVKIKANLGQYLERYYLNNEELTPQFKRTKPTGSDELPTFTRKELEEAGFGWVFDCEGIDVEEVTE